MRGYFQDREVTVRPEDLLVLLDTLGYGREGLPGDRGRRRLTQGVLTLGSKGLEH